MSTRAEQLDSALLESLSKQIRYVAAVTNYDHRPELPKAIGEQFPHLLDAHQLLFSRCKFAVAKILQPMTIYEVGVGWGISARAFMDGFPDAQYFGIDTGEMGLAPDVAMVGIPGMYEIADSDSLETFWHPGGDIDLLHIDGNHERSHKMRDVQKAIHSKVKWLLLDDAHDPMVAAGIFDAFYQSWNRAIPMAFFENSHSGSLLVHIGG